MKAEIQAIRASESTAEGWEAWRTNWREALVPRNVALGLILLSPSFFERYGLDPARAIFPLDNPGIVSIPLSFAVLIVVSLLTKGVANAVSAIQE